MNTTPTPGSGISGDPRLALVTEWTQRVLGHHAVIAPASADASFRRYFRASSGGKQWIVMDAPPGREDIRPWLTVARRFRALGLNVPEVYEADESHGLILMSDLGNDLYLGRLSEATVERLYGDALGALVVLQTGSFHEAHEAHDAREAHDSIEASWLPDYDETLLRNEMELFREWYLVRHLGLSLRKDQNRTIDATFDALTTSALAQPRVWVHRDFHSRNLLWAPSHSPGIIDFQDAVRGPVTYDLMSLLRDAYIAWPRARVEEWVRGYHDLGVQSGLPVGKDEDQFVAWFDLIGIQRQLKVAGIFARLNHRDGKPGYLADIPRVLGYLSEAAPHYEEMGPLLAVLSELRVPGFVPGGA